jgi:DNA polymerase
MSALDALYAAERERLAALENPSRAGDYAHPVFGQGPENPALMLIGEAPGREEAQTGTPFVGKAGRQLDEMLELAGIDRRNVFVTNAVKFRPVNIKLRGISNRTPQRSEVLASLPLLRAEIALVSPRFIATLGNTPLYATSALGGSKPPVVGDVHGQAQTVAIDAARYALFPLYHPASGIYNRELIPIMKEDLVRLGALVREANKT